MPPTRPAASLTAKGSHIAASSGQEPPLSHRSDDADYPAASSPIPPTARPQPPPPVRIRATRRHHPPSVPPARAPCSAALCPTSDPGSVRSRFKRTRAAPRGFTSAAPSPVSGGGNGLSKAPRTPRPSAPRVRTARLWPHHTPVAERAWAVVGDLGTSGGTGQRRGNGHTQGHKARLKVIE